MSNLDSTQVKTALVLGATGGFGSALSERLCRTGWQVRALSRKAPITNQSLVDVQHQINWVVGNLDEPSTLVAAAVGVDLIVHAVNVPYPKWDPLMLNYTQTIIDLAKDNDAHLMFVGNIYNAGLPADGVIDEHTIHAPVNEKGELRARLERMLESASDSGLQTTIMRFGDFFGPDISTNNWFRECTKSIAKNKLTTAGPMDTPHTWAYLPDAVTAMEQVASIRLNSNALPRHMVIPFAGHVFSFSELQQVIETATGTQLKTSSLPWGLFKLLALVMPLMRDIVSMRYLWDHDIRMDNSALSALLGSGIQHTPLETAVRATVPALQAALTTHPATINSNNGAV